MPLVFSNEPETTSRNFTYPAIKSCMGGNPAAPYILAAVKAWPGEYVDKPVVNAFGTLPRGYEPAYRLHPREALVLYGKMPPPGRYMGIQTWQWSQPGHWTAPDYQHVVNLPNQPFPADLLFATMPPADPHANRVFSFSTMGDPMNNIVMQRRSRSPFGTRRYFIVTPSATTDQAVRQVLHARGIPDREIFTEQIPSRDVSGRIGPLGMDKARSTPTPGSGTPCPTRRPRPPRSSGACTRR